MKARNLAIMLTDIKGFTDKSSRKSRGQITEMLNSHNALVLPVISRYNGSVIKTIGDAFLVTFESSTDAVLCGVAIQDALEAFNGNKPPDDSIHIRIAINAGEVSIDDTGDIFGEAVNITSRIEGIAEAGEVFFTEAVYLSMNRNEVPSSEIGYRQFKGIPDKIKVYKVLHEDPVCENTAGATARPEGNDAGRADSKANTRADTGRAGNTGTGPKTEKRINGMSGLAGLITGILGMFGMGNVDIEESDTSKKVRITDGEIHITKPGSEIHIGKDGIIIRKTKQDEPPVL